MNSRRFHREKVSATTVEMTDGITMLEGMVRNVSNTGIEVSLKAELADPHAAKYRLHLSHDDQAYSIAAIPRWQKMDSDGNLVGMRICEAPRNWFSFVNSFSSSHPEKKLFES
jgi:hypothetical protein